MSLYIENYLPVVQQGGLNTLKAVDFSGASSVNLGPVSFTGAQTITSTSASALTVGANGATNPVLKIDASTASVATGVSIKGAAAASGVAIAAISSGTDENLTIDGKGAGTITLGSVSTGRVNVNTSLDITTTSANGLAIGRNGLTNPQFQVNCNTASAATGIRVVGAAAASGVILSVISSGTDENLAFDAKGAGTITINGTATGNIVLGRAATGVSLGVTGAVTTRTATAAPASAGAVAAGPALSMFSNGISFWVTSDAPAFSATKGDICINLAGSSSSTRLYINNGTTNWVAITTAT